MRAGLTILVFLRREGGQKKQPRNPLDTKHKVTLSRKQNKFHYFLYETKNAFWAFFFI